MNCPKCGAELKEYDEFCSKCGKKLKKDDNKLKQNKKLLIGIIIVIAIIIICASAILLSQNNQPTVKTHEFNYANKVSFNISDELTNKTGVNSLLLGESVSYTYKNGLTNMLAGLASGSPDWVESADNTAYYEKISSNKTQQGLETHIYKYEGGYGDEYTVYINLKNFTFTEYNGFTATYDYFTGRFATLEEAQIFINTFKILNLGNSSSTNV